MCCVCGGGDRTGCLSCPAGQISHLGAETLDDCVDPNCDADEYFDTHYQICLPVEFESERSAVPTAMPGDPTALPIPAPTSAPVLTPTPVPSPAPSTDTPTRALHPTPLPSTAAPTPVRPIGVDLLPTSVPTAMSDDGPPDDTDDWPDDADDWFVPGDDWFVPEPTPEATPAPAPTMLPTPTPTRTPVIISSASLLGISCEDFNATIFRLALDSTIGAGDATFSTPACADRTAGGVEISTEVTVALAIAHARGHYGRGAVEAHIISVLDAGTLEDHIQAIAAAHGDRRRLGMSDISVASVAVNTFMPTPAPTPVPTSCAPVPSPSLAPSNIKIPSPSLAPRYDVTPIPSSHLTAVPMPGSTLAPSTALSGTSSAPTAAKEDDESSGLPVTYIVIGVVALLIVGACACVMCLWQHMQAQAKSAPEAMVNVQARAATSAVV